MIRPIELTQIIVTDCSELMILSEKKSFADFFGPLEYKKIIQKILKKYHSEELPKKGTILHQTALINNFYFYLDIIDNIIYKSVLRHQNSHKW